MSEENVGIARRLHEAQHPREVLACEILRTMSQQNLEIVRRGYAAFNRHDFDALLEIVDPDVEWHQITQLPDRATYRGRADLKRLFKQQLSEQFGDFRVEVEELLDAGDHVVMLGHLEGHGAASGAGFRLRIVQVLKLREGKVVWGYDIAAPSVSAQAPGEGGF